MAGGYVLVEKIDQMHQEQPLLGILSTFNNLCVLIGDKNSPEERCEVAMKLKQDFDSDFSVLARLLPMIGSISPQLNTAATEKENRDQMTFHNICFVLQRFMRVVSSAKNPVMLFLDDCQWCSASLLELIHAILSDTRGNCFFFVGR